MTIHELFPNNSTQRPSFARERKGTAAVPDGADLANVPLTSDGTTAAPSLLLVPVESATAGSTSRSRSGIPYPVSNPATAAASTGRCSANELASPARCRVNGIERQQSTAAVMPGRTRTSGGVPAAWYVVIGGRSDSINESHSIGVPGGGNRAASHNPSLRLVVGGANKHRERRVEKGGMEMGQRERQEMQVLERLEAAEGRLRHGDRTGMRILREAITDYDRILQKRVLLERAERLGLTAPTVVRSWSEYQRSQKRERGTDDRNQELSHSQPKSD